MSAATSSIFTGTSQFSQDFQNVITRAVSIASLPLTQMQTDQTTYTNQATALTGLDTTFTALQSAIAAVDAAMGSGSFQTDVSDPTVASVTLGDGAQEGEYSIDVQNVGAYATSLSKANWSAPATPQTYQLYVGAKEYDIKPADNSATTVAAAINAAAGGAVRATVVNVGSSGSPDDRIAMQGVALGDLPVDIKLNGTSLQKPQTVGQVASYIVNGSGNIVREQLAFGRDIRRTDGDHAGRRRWNAGEYHLDSFHGGRVRRSQRLRHGIQCRRVGGRRATRERGGSAEPDNPSFTNSGRRSAGWERIPLREAPCRTCTPSAWICRRTGP